MSMDLYPKNSVMLDIAAALFVHAVYKRSEFMPSQHLPTFIFLILVPLCSAIPKLHSSSQPITIIAISYFLFYLSLLTSIILYRISPLHPLAKYPGPFLAKVSKLWGAYSMMTGKNHETIRRLHEKYGMHVRIGPNELSTIDVPIISSVLGADGMPKGPMWDARVDPNIKVRSLIATRSLHEHAFRRKRWNRAFSTSSVKGYEPIITMRALQLAGELERKSQSLTGGSDRQVVNLAQWLTFFAFDFMGDMAFGGGFELMRDGGDLEGIWKLMDDALEISAVIQHVPWLGNILFQFPSVTNNINRLRQFSMEKAKGRKESGAVVKDLFYHLIDEDHVEKERPSEAEILSDGLLAIVAGSDTTSTVLSGLFFNLCSHPKYYKQLQDEVDSVFPPADGDPFDSAKLANMPYLNAIINESLRIQPPVTTSIQRAPAKGSGGKLLGTNMWIPEGTSITVPLYALSRSPVHFSPHPDEFWPERWLHASFAKRTPTQFVRENDLHPKLAEDVPISKVVFNRGSNVDSAVDEVFTNAAAFIPFSYGPANCAGRNLALVEMRMVVALLVQRFDMKFAEGYDPARWEREMKDWLTLKLGSLPVVLTPRA